MTIDVPSVVIVNTTDTKGREFLASRAIKPNEIIFHVYPYATAIFEGHRKRVCAYCSCIHPTRSFSMHCKACDQVYFCSPVCFGTYMRYHDTQICSALRKLATLKKVGRHEKSVAKLVLAVFWQRRHEVEPFSTDHDLVSRLESHYLDWDEDLKNQWRKVRQFLQVHLPDENPIDIMHCVSRVESNGFGIHIGGRKEPVGRALYPIVSMLNHDCDCNCEADQTFEADLMGEKVEENIIQADGSIKVVVNYPDVFSTAHGGYRSMIIRSLRDVQAHEPLTISYIDSTLPVNARRRQLIEDYFFECECDRCVKETATPGIAGKLKKKQR
ncbi:hypothetical protein BX666DRAFT_353236 [Dichotomocladium elegans]|nr:hypothetical protein BX666DRAFT_353236 [Dichotomocladium elegans]